VNLTLVTIAKFSETMLWVVGFLFVADFAAIVVIVVRTGKVDQDEGQVVTEQGSGGNVLGAGRYVAKEKILVSRSEYITDASLVDGTATKTERLLVHCAQIAFFLFWLLFVFIGLRLLPSNPIQGAFFVIVPTIGFSKAGVGMYRGRTEALRQLKKRKAASRRARQQA
jgi:hypothetical protein